jgi:hypothetical protein
MLKRNDSEEIINATLEFVSSLSNKSDVHT